MTSFMLSLFLVSASGMVTYYLFTRGPAFVLNFIFFAFALAFSRGYFVVFEENLPHTFGMPVIMHSAAGTLVVIAALFLSWYLASRITDRMPLFAQKLFPTLFFAGIAVAAIAYAVTAAVTRSFYGIVPVFPRMESWIFLSLCFLCAYFLITSTVVRTREWKSIFFLLPFAYIWIPLFAGARSRLVLDAAVFLFPAVLSFACPLRLDFPGPAPSPVPLKRARLEDLALGSSFMVLLTLFSLEAVLLREHALLSSLLPFAAVLMLAARIPVWGALLFTFFCFSLDPAGGLAAAVPVVFYMSFSFAGRILRREGK